MNEKYFLTEIKCKNGVWEKGVVIKGTLDAARQSFHAYLGAYGYGNDPETIYVSCYITDIAGNITDIIVDNRMGA